MTIDEAKHMRLTFNFNLWEFLYSEDAIKHGLMQNQLEIPELYILHLKRLCVNVLQPLRDEFNVTVKINSGYRCPELNKAVGGVDTSDHLLGFAADIYVPGRMSNAFAFIKRRCKYKQLINEHNLTWIHVSYDELNNKMEAFDL